MALVLDFALDLENLEERMNYLLIEAKASFPALQALVTPSARRGAKDGFHVTVTVTDVGRIRTKSTLSK